MIQTDIINIINKTMNLEFRETSLLSVNEKTNIEVPKAPLIDFLLNNICLKVNYLSLVLCEIMAILKLFKSCSSQTKNMIHRAYRTQFV